MGAKDNMLHDTYRRMVLFTMLLKLISCNDLVVICLIAVKIIRKSTIRFAKRFRISGILSYSGQPVPRYLVGLWL